MTDKVNVVYAQINKPGGRYPQGRGVQGAYNIRDNDRPHRQANGRQPRPAIHT